MYHQPSRCQLEAGTLRIKSIVTTRQCRSSASEFIVKLLLSAMGTTGVGLQCRQRAPTYSHTAKGPVGFRPWVPHGPHRMGLPLSNPAENATPHTLWGKLLHGAASKPGEARRQSAHQRLKKPTQTWGLRCRYLVRLCKSGRYILRTSHTPTSPISSVTSVVVRGGMHGMWHECTGCMHAFVQWPLPRTDARTDGCIGES